MTDINIVKIYNLVDNENNQLQLRLGELMDRDGLLPKDMGWRWSFVGTKIPMPVRCGTWFNGFPVNVMIDWLKSNGWTMHTCVNLFNGKVSVYDTTEEDKTLNVIEERALMNALTLLVKDGHATRASILYRCVYGGSMTEANDVVRAIYRANEANM
jgi:hypothetical protein